MDDSFTSLPEGWTSVELSLIAEVRLGRQRSPSRAKGKHMRPYLRAANVSWDGINLHDIKEMDFTPDEFEIYSLKKGDILLTEASGSLSEVGKPGIWNDEMAGVCFQNTLIRVRTHPDIAPFVYWTLRYAALTGEFAAEAKGVGIHHLGATKLSSWRILVPPLGEQARIVAKILDAQSRIKRAESELAEASRLLALATQAVLSNAFDEDYASEQSMNDVKEPSGAELLNSVRIERRERWEQEQVGHKAAIPSDDDWKSEYKGPVPLEPDGLPELPDDWCWVAAEEIVEPGAEIVYGILQPGPNRPDGTPYVRGVDIQDGILLIDQLWRTSPDLAAKYHKASLKGGDILLGIIRATKVAIVPQYIREGEITQSRTTARFRPSNAITTDFLAKWLQSPFAQSWLHGHYRGIDMPGLNLRDIRRLPVPLAPLGIQKLVTKRIEDRLARINSAGLAVSEADQHLRHIERSLLRRAFDGQLVPPDAEDESSVTLLERVKSHRIALRKQLNSVKERKGKVNMVKKQSVRATLAAWLHKNSGQNFSFEDIREGVPANYEDIKEAIFSLLDDPGSGLQQYFDQNQGAIRFRSLDR